MASLPYMVTICEIISKRFCQKKKKKSEKNSKVGGWVKSQLGLLFLGDFVFVFFVLFLCFQMFKKKKIGNEGRWAGSDSGFFLTWQDH